VKALVAFVVTLAALVAPGAAGAADCTKTSVSDLEDEVMCPVCGTSLGLAREAPQARRESAFIARLVDRCHSKEEIKAALVAEFGDGVLALPSHDGFNLSAYLAPLFGILLSPPPASVLRSCAGAGLRQRHRNPERRLRPQAASTHTTLHDSTQSSGATNAEAVFHHDPWHGRRPPSGAEPRGLEPLDSARRTRTGRPDPRGDALDLGRAASA
jgi:cytochrome c-type biogenesis protein CcmH/NrfF